MNEPTHIIDPDGEVIMILRNTDYPFADGIEEHLESTPAEDIEPAPEEDLEPAPVEPAVDEPAAQIIFRIQVSAKHLSFASPVFKTILKGGWKESITFLQKGTVELTAESWDVEALLILLRAIHGQYRLITQKLTLEMLAKVAVIADY
ncbi:hypothetical protein N7520_008215 [Penicillium odoratum]|uniref:uncharacterized protein n=1 Tax=Penicillium odoratum TaxID=1167516 RepID=UPI00254838E1|nr:uncharacterized protein N7520_008215 [Penicillium odoratum]KAJ5761059.1 hypothetical protein N7520_008215 [Penicillium odoratum]